MSDHEKNDDLDKKIDQAFNVANLIIKGLHEKDRKLLESPEIIEFIENSLGPLAKTYYEKAKDAYLR